MNSNIRKFMIATGAIVLSLSLSGAVLAQGYYSDEKPVQGITVTGTADVKSKPDTAFVTFGVITQDANAAKAAQQNAAIANAIIDAVVKTGIAKTDIETTGYSVSPVMDYQKNPAVLIGYQVSNQVKAKVRNITKIGALIDAATKAGANNVQGVDFVTEDNAKIREQALSEAAKDAQKKAQTLADTLGVKLGKVISITEIGSPSPRPLEYAMKSDAMMAATPILPGNVTSTATVKVVFSIL